MPRRTAFTSRAAILALAVAALAVMLAVPLKVWLSQRAQIDGLRRHVSTQQRHVAQLKRDDARWHDPAFVRRQARQRLRYVRPGDTLYTMLGPAAKPSPSQPTSHPAPRQARDQPWYDRLWDGMMTADSRHGDSRPSDSRPSDSQSSDSRPSGSGHGASAHGSGASAR